MDVSEIRTFALSLPETTEDMPFGPGTVVFKVHHKIYLLLSLDSDPVQFNVKCDPDEAVLLREQYNSVLPGYHMNKKHWNTILINGELRNDFLKQMIRNSYDLVNSKPKQRRIRD